MILSLLLIASVTCISELEAEKQLEYELKESIAQLGTNPSAFTAVKSEQGEQFFDHLWKGVKNVVKKMTSDDDHPKEPPKEEKKEEKKEEAPPPPPPTPPPPAEEKKEEKKEEEKPKEEKKETPKPESEPEEAKPAEMKPMKAKPAPKGPAKPKPAAEPPKPEPAAEPPKPAEMKPKPAPKAKPPKSNEDLKADEAAKKAKAEEEAAEAARLKAEQEKKAAAEAKAKAEAEAKAAKDAKAKAEAEAKAAAEQKALEEAEAKARAAAEAKSAAEAKLKAEQAAKEAAEAKAKAEAEAKLKAEEEARAAAEAKAKAEAEAKAAAEAKAKAEAEAKAAAAARALEEAEAEARRKAEEEARIAEEARKAEELAKQEAARKAAEERAAEEAAAAKARAEAEAKAAEERAAAERARIAAEEAAAAAAAKAAAEAKAAEEARIAEEKAQRAREKAQKEAEEAARKAAEEAAEKARKEAAEARKKAEEEERKRLEEEARQKKLEEEARKRREAAEKARIEAEERRKAEELAAKAAKAAAEKARKDAEEAARKAAEEEKKRREEEARKAAAAAKAKAEAEAAEALAAQRLKEAGAFQIPGCSKTEFTERGDKSDYRGCQSRTLSGIQCQPWNTDKPHTRGGQYKNMYNKGEEGLGDHNYCRSAKWGALWCYTSSSGKNWERCEPETEETYGKWPQPFHAPGCAASEEMHHANDYRGCQFKTKSGYTCQNWGVDKPHARGNQYKNYFNKGEEGIGDHNFCRSGRWGGLWCYTTDPKKNWERCDPLKKEDVPEGWDIPALIHNEKAAKLRAEAEAKAALELKIASAFQIPGCSTTEYTEKNDASDYRGCQSRTRSGIQCQPWNTDKPHGRGNQYKNMYNKGEEGLGDHNYCRSAKWGALWCYTSSSGKKWERCDPETEETYGKWPQPFHAPKCPASEEMHHPNDYRGCQTKTRGGFTCQPWNTDKPHARGGQYKNYYNKGEEGIGDHNYCRSGRWGALWCYTDDPKKNWDRCDPLTADSFEKDDAADKHNAEAAKAKAAAEKAAAEKKALEEKKRKEAEEAARKARAEAEARRKKMEEEKRKRREAELAAKAAQKAAEEEARQRAEQERLRKIALEKAEKEAAEARARAEAKRAEQRAWAIKAAKAFSAPGCEFSEFTEKGDRSDYKGCQTRTRGGYRCQHWNSDEFNKRNKEHKEMYEKGEYGLGDHNYCRTARGGAGGLWCYTDNPFRSWDQCDPMTEESFKANPPAPTVPGCPSDEFASGGSNDYRGCQNKTLQGYTCQNWGSDEPHERSRASKEFYEKKEHGWGDHNYCRAERTGRLWCYTTDPKKLYDVCQPITREELEVPFTAPGCSASEKASGYQTDYRGCQSKTESGRTCMNWGHIAPHHPNNKIKEAYKKGEMGIGDHNFCRNGDRSEKRIWCYTTDPRRRWEYCNPHTEDDYKPPKQPFKIPGCDKSEFSSGREEDYRGCQTKTKSGFTCQNWSQDSPHNKNGRAKDAFKRGEKGIGDHNYCRNPDGEKNMWCYTTDPKKRWEYCEPATEEKFWAIEAPKPPKEPFHVPGCDKNEKATGNQKDYRGCQGMTESGRTCQSWSLDSPHNKNRQSRDALNKGEKGIGEHNFCRNPDGEPRMWCYTTDPKKRWEYCNPATENNHKPVEKPPPKPKAFEVPGCDATEFASGKQEDYRGCQGKTESGRTCQSWTLDSPHNKNRQSRDALNKGEKGIGEHNYCRNPDGEPRMWCYTTDPKKRWEYCNPATEDDYKAVEPPKPPKPPVQIPGCDKNEFASGTQEDYRGCQRMTESGRTCQKWSLDSPHNKNRQSRNALNKGEKGIGDHNYCRNPDGEKRMWCYTTDPKKRWEYCNSATEDDIVKFQQMEDDRLLREAIKRNETAAQEEAAAEAKVKAFEAQIAALMAMLKQAQMAHAAADKKSDQAHDDLEKLLNDDADADAKDEDAANDAETEAKKAEEQAEILKEEEKALEKAKNDAKIKKAEKEAKKRKEEQEDDKKRAEQEAAEEAELAAKKAKENAEQKKEEEEAKKKAEESTDLEAAKAQLEKEKANALEDAKKKEEEIKAKKDEEEAKKALEDKKAEEKAEKDAERAEAAKKAAEKAKEETKSKEAAEKAKTKEEKAAAALKLKEEEDAKLAAEQEKQEAEAEALKKKEEEARQAAKKEEENKAAAMASEIAAKAAQANEAAKAGEELAKKKEEAAKKAAEERKKKRDERRKRRRNRRRRNRNRKRRRGRKSRKGRKGKVAQKSSLPYFGQSNASSSSQNSANLVKSPASFAITPSSVSPQAPQSISMVSKQQEQHTVAVPLPLTSSGDKSEPQTVSISITLVEKDKKEDVKLIGPKKI